MKRSTLAFTLLLLVALLRPQPVAAHPSDMNFQSHTITLAEDAIVVDWVIRPGPALIPTVWNEADLNTDNTVSEAEAESWMGQRIDFYYIGIDGSLPLPLEVQSVTFPRDSQSFWLGKEGISIQMQASADGLEAGNELRIINGLEATTSTNWFTVAAADNLGFDNVEQEGNQLTLTISSGTGALSSWDSGQLAGRQTVSEVEQTRAAERLTQLISTSERNVWFYVTALAISVVLGAVHALTPGHGKAMVGAYLVGSRGTPQHAVVLGAIVTLTHTGSVIGFGVLALTATQFLAPATALPLLELISGALIVVFGLIILRQRWVGYAAVKRHQTTAPPQLSPKLIHATATADGPRTISVGKSIAINQPVPQPIREPSLSWKSLAGLGVSGGLVPCPDAVAILLVATAINRLVLGLTMTVAFSLGLAVVLNAVGLAMVRGRSLIQRFEGFERYTPLLPLLSAIVVILLGLLLVFKNAGSIEAAVEAPIVRNAHTRLSIMDRQADVVFVSNKDGQLYGLDLWTGEVQALTHGDAPITSVVVSSDDSQLAYSMKVDGVDGIYLLDFRKRHPEPILVTQCPTALCRVSAWGAMADTLLIEWSDQSDLTQAQLPVLQTLNTDTGERLPVFENTSVASITPRVSQSGEWLAYILPGATQICVENYTNGDQYRLINGARDVLDWHPEDDLLLYTNFATESNHSHLYRLNVTMGEEIDLTRSDDIEDLLAVWSPTGEWIATVRREAGSATDEVWLMRANGSGARQISMPPGAQHFTPTWSPDGRYLLTTWLVTEGEQYFIGLIDIEGGQSTLIATGVFKPLWIE